MTTSEVVEQVAADGLAYGRETLRHVLAEEGRVADGPVVRVRPGAFRLRVACAPPATTGVTAREHVLAALTAMRAAGRGPVTFRELEEQVAGLGLRYSARTLYHGLRQQLVDPTSDVVRIRPRRSELSR